MTDIYLTISLWIWKFMDLEDCNPVFLTLNMYTVKLAYSGLRYSERESLYEEKFLSQRRLNSIDIHLL